MIEQCLWRLEEAVVEELDERPELERVPLVGSRREEEKIPRVTAQRFGQPVWNPLERAWSWLRRRVRGN